MGWEPYRAMRRFYGCCGMKLLVEMMTVARKHTNGVEMAQIIVG
jgi:hypothetical protein